jgi:hypothetical protein
MIEDEKRQKVDYKPLHRKLKIEQHEHHNVVYIATGDNRTTTRARVAH